MVVLYVLSVGFMCFLVMNTSLFLFNKKRIEQNKKQIEQNKKRIEQVSNQG